MGFEDGKNANAMTSKFISPEPLGMEASLGLLEHTKAVVIGGTLTWQNKLKRRLPHFTYLPGNSTDFDEALIIQTGIVFANVTTSFSHECLNRVIKIVSKYEKRIVFLPITRMNLTIYQMASAVANPPSDTISILDRITP